MSEQRIIFRAPPGGGRLDHLLVARLPEHSRNRLQSLIRQGLVLVNGEAAAKTGLQLDGGEKIELSIPPIEPTVLEPEAIPLDIIFENGDLILINKPAGMVVHPSVGHDRGTLVHAVLAHAPDLEGVGGELRPGVVHRLDKDTSGLILMAKNDAALRSLQSQFKQRQVEKTYLALVDGAPPTPSGTIEAAIGRDPRQRKRMAVVRQDKGREASTFYRTLQSYPEHSLLEALPETGRTHQIRVHLAFIHCPIVADTVYGRRRATIELDRHFLHAARLTFALPGSETRQTFEAPLPPELQQVLDELAARRTL